VDVTPPPPSMEMDRKLKGFKIFCGFRKALLIRIDERIFSEPLDKRKRLFLVL
jgi:hypothetical protein